jgi:5-amino-6-(5-phosphoribosylamino)uracil reductase
MPGRTPAQGPELRLVLAVSLDGRLAPAQGGAAQLGGPGDRRVLEEALAWADGCLIGARTLRLHGCSCLIHAPDLLEERRRQGRPDQPAALVVSRRADFDPGLRFFSQPLERWLLTPVPSSAVPPPGFAAVQALHSWPDTLRELAGTGLQRLVLLGGADLAGQLLDANLVDQMQLTLCPQLLGGPHSWLPAGLDLAASRWSLLELRPLEGEELLLRYARP